MKKSSQPLSPGNFRGWRAAPAAESGSASDELYRRMIAEAVAAANASLKKVKATEEDEAQIEEFAATAKPGTVLRRAAPTQLTLPRMPLPAVMAEEEAAEAAAAAADVGLRLNLKSAGIPSTFNNNANFSEYTENPPLGLYFNRQRSINEGRRKEALRQATAAEMAREARLSPLGRLASMQHSYAEHMRAAQGLNAVRMGLAPLPSTPGSMPPPRMYVPGQQVPGGSGGAAALMNNTGGRRKQRRKSRKTRKSRKSHH